MKLRELFDRNVPYDWITQLPNERYTAKFIVDNKIGPGAQVEIIRSGDVIPKIEKVIKMTHKCVICHARKAESCALVRRSPLR